MSATFYTSRTANLGPEPLGRPMLAALLAHGLLAGIIVGWALIHGWWSHNNWGSNEAGGAVAVQLVSNALPLPADQKPNENVLATETPSQAPAPPAAPVKATQNQDAIPIATKVTPPKKLAQKQQQATKHIPLPLPLPQQRSNPYSKQVPQNRAAYGEQASSQMQRSVTATSDGPVSVTSGTRGFNYPFYVENIKRRMLQSLYRGEIDPRTAKGAQAYIIFTIQRNGAPSDIRMDRSSGSPTLDQACLRAAQRVDSFGPLPSPVTDGPLHVSYYCEY
jgi:protein TonB